MEDESIKLPYLLGVEDREGMARYCNNPKGNLIGQDDKSLDDLMVDIRLTARDVKIQEIEEKNAQAEAYEEACLAAAKKQANEAKSLGAKEWAPTQRPWGDSVADEYINTNPYQGGNSEEWWQTLNADLREEWKRLAGLTPPGLQANGMPLIISEMAQGKALALEEEIIAYCKLSGLQYKTSRSKLEAEAIALKKLCKATMKRVDELVETFMKLQYSTYSRED